MHSYVKEPTLVANFLLGTKPITNFILGFFGITDHYITVNKDLGWGNRFGFKQFRYSRFKKSVAYFT